MKNFASCGLIVSFFSCFASVSANAASASFDLGVDATNLQTGFAALGASAAGTLGPVTATATTSDVASGSIRVTLAAGGTAAAALAVDATTGDLNSAASITARDRTFPGSDAAPFTFSRVYRDFLTANAFGIEFSGLNPYTPYQLTFYAYDHSGSRIQTFATATGSAVAPTASLTYTGGTTFTASTPNNIFATTLTATSNEQGKIFISATGTGQVFGTGTSSSVQTLGGLEISPAATTQDAAIVPLFQHHYDGNFSDASGHGHTGTAAAGATITTTSNAIASGTGALSLNGSATGIVTLTNPITLTSTQPWSASWWSKKAETGGNKGMVMGDASNNGDFIWQSASGLRFRSTASTSTTDFAFTPDLLIHHYVLTATGAGGMSLYRDGVLVSAKTGLNTSLVINTIGNAYLDSGYQFQGSLDEVQLFGASLTAAQISNIYTREKPIGPPPVPVTRIRVILQGGQSNSDGRAPIADLPTSPVNLQLPQDDVDFLYGAGASFTTLRPGVGGATQFGPEITLGRKMADLWAGDTGTRVAILKYAAGGTNLAYDWKPDSASTADTADGKLYATFKTAINSGLAKLASTYPGAVIDIQGMVWFQGESDAVATIDVTTGQTYALSYQTNLTRFIAAIRANYGQIPFIIGRLSNNQTSLNTTYRNQVRAAMDAVDLADPLTGIIDTDGFPMNSDNLHFNAFSQLAIGNAFAAQLSYYEWMVDHFTTADINAGLAEQAVDYDGDGQSNLKEFLASTDPKLGGSVLAATFVYLNPTAGKIDYSSSANRTYSVEHYLEGTNSWETTLPSLRGTGALVSRPLALSNPRGIYRVRADIP